MILDLTHYEVMLIQLLLERELSTMKISSFVHGQTDPMIKDIDELVKLLNFAHAA